MSGWFGSFNNNNEPFSKLSSGNVKEEFIKQQLQRAYDLSDLSEKQIEKKYMIFLKKELDSKNSSIDLLVGELFNLVDNERKEIINKWNKYYEEKASFKISYDALVKNNT